MSTDDDLTFAEASEEAARERLRGNWDEGGTVSVTVPADVARTILEAKGWERKPSEGWFSPGGHRYWEIDEALMVALVAEAS